MRSSSASARCVEIERVGVLGLRGVHDPGVVQRLRLTRFIAEGLLHGQRLRVPLERRRVTTLELLLDADPVQRNPFAFRVANLMRDLHGGPIRVFGARQAALALELKRAHHQRLAKVDGHQRRRRVEQRLALRRRACRRQRVRQRAAPPVKERSADARRRTIAPGRLGTRAHHVPPMVIRRAVSRLYRQSTILARSSGAASGSAEWLDPGRRSSLIACCWTTTASLAPSSPTRRAVGPQRRLSFEANRGQVDQGAVSLPRAWSTVFLSPSESALALSRRRAATQKPCCGCTCSAPIPRRTSSERDVARTRQLPDRARSGQMAPQHSDLRARPLRTGLSGIDLIYYGNPKQLEYDFIVSPGAEASAITDRRHGRRRCDQGWQRRYARPRPRRRGPAAPAVRSYQEADGVRHEITGGACSKALRASAFGSARAMRRPLVIIRRSTTPPMSGGRNKDEGNAIAIVRSVMHLY